MDEKPDVVVERRRELARVRNRRYFENNRTAVLERNRQRRLRDREKDRERLRQWRAAHPELSRAYARKARNADVEGARLRCREWRAAHPDYAPAQSVKLAEHRTAIRDFLSELKRFVGCIDCGYRDNPLALDFDHIGPKGASIGALFNVKRITEELGQCVVRCANCHAIRTAERRPPRISRGAFVRQVADLKTRAGCVDCGFRAHPAALHFDHISGEKVWQISRFRSMAKARDELEKCVVRCANDHRIITHARR